MEEVSYSIRNVEEMLFTHCITKEKQEEWRLLKSQKIA